jgi:uncharacterized SAM-binding protein YcdF (DUF218 family)
MFFTLAKLLSPLFDPLNALVVLTAIGALLLLWRKKRAGTVVVGASAFVLVVVSITPLAPWMLHELESVVPRPAQLPARVDGILLLGGAQDTRLTEAYGNPHFNGDASAIFEFLSLARRYPEARLAFSGGSGLLSPVKTSEGEVMRRLVAQAGLAPTRLSVEEKSRDTFENAALSKALLAPKAGEVWMLVAAARHMPRAKATFERQGWTVLAYPAAYRAPPDAWKTEWDLDATGNFRDLGQLVHEALGYAAYRIAGRL